MKSICAAIKAEFEVDKPGVSTAMLNNIKVHHWQDAKSATVEGKSVLITKPYTLNTPLTRAHAIIRHPEIRDTDFNMLINLGETTAFAEMTLINTYTLTNGEIEEEFEFIAPADSTAKTISVKVEIIQKSGSVANEVLGTGTGKQQTFKLPHHAKTETIQLTGATEWAYKEKTDTLLVTANDGNDQRDAGPNERDLVLHMKSVCAAFEILQKCFCAA